MEVSVTPVQRASPYLAGIGAVLGVVAAVCIEGDGRLPDLADHPSWKQIWYQINKSFSGFIVGVGVWAGFAIPVGALVGWLVSKRIRHTTTNGEGNSLRPLVAAWFSVAVGLHWYNALGAILLAAHHGRHWYQYAVWLYVLSMLSAAIFCAVAIVQRSGRSASLILAYTALLALVGVLSLAALLFPDIGWVGDSAMFLFPVIGPIINIPFLPEFPPVVQHVAQTGLLLALVWVLFREVKRTWGVPTRARVAEDLKLLRSDFSLVDDSLPLVVGSFALLIYFFTPLLDFNGSPLTHVSLLLVSGVSIATVFASNITKRTLVLLVAVPLTMIETLLLLKLYMRDGDALLLIFFAILPFLLALGLFARWTWQHSSPADLCGIPQTDSPLYGVEMENPDSKKLPRNYSILLRVVSGYLFYSAAASIALMFSDVAASFGFFYQICLAIAAVVVAISAYGLWRHYKWGAWTYVAFMAVNQPFLYFMGWWVIYTLVIPGIVVALIFSKYKWLK